MDLPSGRLISRPKVTKCMMSLVIIFRVEAMAAMQGVNTMDLKNRKEELMIPPIDQLTVVVGDIPYKK